MNQNKLLLHSCCAPCTTASFEELIKDNNSVDVFWYNPNIEDEIEHNKRLDELHKLAKLYSFKIIDDYSYSTENKLWHGHIAGLENEPEGGERCKKCFEFRLKKAAQFAKDAGYDFFTTSLTISPYKNSKIINKIGESFGDLFLVRDFKKNNGYQRSIEISKKLGLYRQKYCGCRYGKQADQPN